MGQTDGRMNERTSLFFNKLLWSQKKMKVFPHTDQNTFVIGERLNRFSSMIIDKIRRVVKAKQQETTEVRETTKIYA